MPVIGTPGATTQQGGQAQGISQLTVTPSITLVEGALVPAKMQAVKVSQGQQAMIQWTMKTADGLTVDLTTLAGYTVQLAIREALFVDSTNPGTLVTGVVLNAGSGLVGATLPLSVVTLPGISYAEFGMISPAGALVFSNTFFLFVEPSQFGPQITGLGPLTVAELRLYLRDADPAGNLWLASFEWDLAEIAACVVRPVREFNEAPPPLDQMFTTAAFPWRDNWARASAGYLMRLAADWYRRVHLPYQAGGLSIDDKNKADAYDKRGQELIEDWRHWMQWKKVQINCEGAFQSMGSSYSNFGWY